MQDKAHKEDAPSPIPMTTEEPVRRPWLKEELKEINDDPEATTKTTDESSVTSEDDEEEDDDSITGKNKIKHLITESPPSEASPKVDESYQGMDMMACLSREVSDYQERLDDLTEHYEQQVADAATEEDLLGVVDPELLKRTESNRHIPLFEKEVIKQRPKRSDTIHGQSDAVHKDLLVFSDHPEILESTSNKLVVAQYYGAGKSGVMPEVFKNNKKKQKRYLIACDFSKESLYAIEWTMGTMMRDGDELHVATVANREDNPEAVKATGLDQAGELRATSDALITEAKKLLGQMMLFNIKLVTHAMVGRVKDVLKSLAREKNYTMIICGSRGRSSVKSLLMGSVSTYLVHKSPVPVAVIRKQKKKKRVRHEPLEAHSLTEGIKTGHLHVDELS